MILSLVLVDTDWSGCVIAGHAANELQVRWSEHPGRTYWDYTQLRFPRREGMRIDFVLGSPALAARVGGALIDREERKGKGASDHAPVVVDLTE
jgi:exonuclease III